jgi:hypothetical protein
MHYLAAAKSLQAQGFVSEGHNLFDSAATEAQLLEDKRLAEHIKLFRASLEANTTK